MKIQDDGMNLQHAVSRITVDRHGDREWYGGCVLTLQGIVGVYYEPAQEYFRVDFVWRERLHIRTFRDRTWTKLGMTRMASRFAKSVAEGR